ncbi:hypothetical protein FC49_GL001873 [Limosilactobacillus oris DSM 4864]|uniref:Uncharacterized protein n=1 Tax=Limosilactobacillus oris DSM 4864 TaxID=1423779 RepID=A0A0R1WE29_9LACO|nr:hypothetical protein FC49_GL001873 [Limosilactobacillus oris DSM 4864]
MASSSSQVNKLPSYFSPAPVIRRWVIFCNYYLTNFADSSMIMTIQLENAMKKMSNVDE